MVRELGARILGLRLAEPLKQLGSQDGLDAQRAAAVGEIARRQLAPYQLRSRLQASLANIDNLSLTGTGHIDGTGAFGPPSARYSAMKP